MTEDQIIKEILGHLRGNPKEDFFPVLYERLEAPTDFDFKRAVVTRSTMYNLLEGPLKNFLREAMKYAREQVKIEFDQRMVFIDKATLVPGIDPGLLVFTAKRIEKYITNEQEPVCPDEKKE